MRQFQGSDGGPDGRVEFPQLGFGPKLPPSGGWNLRQLQGSEPLEAGICDSSRDLMGPRWEVRRSVTRL